MAVGFGTSPTDHWLSVDRSDWSGFSDNWLQGFLLEYLTVDGVVVDPYDGGVFHGEQLDTLTRQLDAAIALINAQPSEWPFLEEPLRKQYFEACKRNRIEPIPARDRAIQDLREVIRLATKARTKNHYLVFCGD